MDRPPASSPKAAPVAAAGDGSLRTKSFYLPGTYVAQEGGARMTGAMHVELWRGEVTRPYPVVMLHGGGQTGSCFTTKPDGGEGWAQAFARNGFPVYVIDEPGRGRSPLPFDAGDLQPVFAAETAEKIFTACAHHRQWPGAELHTQWPGSGRRGDPIFDRFYASQAPQLRDHAAMEQTACEAVAALLQEIGPAILLSHSQGAPRGWRVADRYPELVKGVLAIEPMGRPFYWTTELAIVFGLPPETVCHPYGLAIGPLTYEPEADLSALIQWRAAQNAGRWRLARLAGVPITLVSGEASYHRSSDLELSEFLTAMGVEHRLLALEEIGIHGNGHMMMLEKNSDQIADALIDQISVWGL
jgi:pimeloyl-ACP methyl ester carboxylesterase